MAARQRIAAYALITDEAGRVLLARHPDERGHRGRWVLPGGGVEHGEHPEQALLREIREETGLTASVGELRHVLSDVTRVGRRRRRLHNVRLVYAASVAGAGGNARLDENALSEGARWCEAAEWGALPLAPFTQQVLSYRLSARLSASPRTTSGEILGLGSSCDRPFQARFTRCAAISSSLGLRTSSHHWPAKATMPTSILA